MSKPKSPVQIQVAITLNPDAMEYVEKNTKDGDLAGTISQWCNFFLDRQSRGGILLEPDDHSYLAELNEGRKFKDSRSLVKAVEKGLHRESGQFTFVVHIDPAHIQPIKEQAQMSGITPEELVDLMVNKIMADGSLWDFSPSQGRSIPFTGEMLQATAELCGKHNFNSSDIAGLIAEDRFLPVTRETQKRGRELMGKLEFRSGDLDKVFDELVALREQVQKLKRQPREVVAA